MAYARTPNAEASPEWSPDGYGNKLYNETYYGENAYDKDVDRYRDRGNPIDVYGNRKQAAVQLDQTDANQTRGMEMGSLASLQNAATGGAPSQAAIMSKGATEAAGTAASTAQQGGHGNALGAARGAQVQLAGTAAQSAGQMMQLRNKETTTDMGAYAGAAAGMHGQDVNAATTNAQLEAAQRALEQQRQQSNERMGFDARRVQASATKESLRQQQQERERQRANAAAKSQADRDNVMTVIRTAASLGTAAAAPHDADQQAADPYTTSDERAKMHIGSLSGFRYGGR
jgi:hypothetical protein